MSHIFSFQRLLAMLIKEFIQMRRDRVTFAMMLGVPLVQLVLFGYAINNDPRGLPTALVTMANGPYARAAVTALENSEYFKFTEKDASPSQALSMLRKGKITFIVTIPSDFAKQAEAGTPNILIEADATDPAASGAAVASAPAIIEQAIANVKQKNPSLKQDLLTPSTIIHRKYNPEGVTQYNIVPALLGVILQLTLVMMTSIALTRETERGTMENLLSMPASPFEIMCGKVMPYIVVGAVQVVVVLVAGKVLFSIPFEGTLMLLIAATLVFVIALVLLGYFISTVATTQMQALQIAFFFFLPSLLLSGFMFPYAGMPEWAQKLGEVFPLTHFLRVVRAILLKGAEWHEVSASVYMLFLFVALLSLLALKRFKRTLD
ncbi:Inner membrane transport permease YbhR [Pseudovibrio axinellae]|uniref:Transport permease protein n=1 Tax=Pseudovibrio axinellae TaxID=989403 RepID=A0A165SWN7_9HYPH|nr:ABC transporter permease [Pseudovibrio axinellae]KZL04578.1 Inner membrane transport permease YbhR [Pseudovibrio axinellae]SEQ72451.1 ABC-2 type transport system permease protein [Pseudovibrio axinellae]